MSRRDAVRLHYLEATAANAVRAFVEASAEEVWQELSLAGMGGPDNCLTAVNLWARRMRNADIPFEQLGSQTTIGLPFAGGYRLTGGQVVDHHFIAVGAELALFDPTAGSRHIGHSADMSLDRYVVADGTPFPEWRRRRLEQAK